MANELITIEQFAKRMVISRSTVYGWLAAGKLQQGVHLIKIGRVVRIVWSDDLMSHLLELSKSNYEPGERPLLKKEGKGGHNRIAFDCDYLKSLQKDMV